MDRTYLFVPPEEHAELRFRKVVGSEYGAGVFSNHCAHCGALQDEFDLHGEPDSPFFDIPRATPGSVRLTPLAGAVRFSGDERFAVE
jgi:hypothetical protein